MGWMASLIRSVGSALYWWGVGWTLYVVVGGDPLPLGRSRGILEEYGPVAIVLVVAVVLHARLLRPDRRR